MPLERMWRDNALCDAIEGFFAIGAQGKGAGRQPERMIWFAHHFVDRPTPCLLGIPP